MSQWKSLREGHGFSAAGAPYETIQYIEALSANADNNRQPRGMFSVQPSWKDFVKLLTGLDLSLFSHHP